MAGIHDPLNHHLTPDEIIKLFRIYNKVKDQRINDQTTAFNNLKKIIFKTEKFDNQLF